MTATYDRLDLNFMYPENWKLLDSGGQLGDDGHAVSLESPDGSSTWSVHVYAANTDLDELKRETIAAMNDTYQDLEIAPIEETIAGNDCRGIEAMFYCLDFLIRARLLWVQTNERLLLIWTQAEDRDFDKQALVFSAISTSLLKG